MKICKYCNKEITGNPKKIFCNTICKNKYGNEKQKIIRKEKYHYCIICKKIIIDYHSNQIYCGNECKNISIIEKSKEKYKEMEYVECMICGYRGKSLPYHLYMMHNITLKKYMIMYNKTLDDVILKSTRKLWGDKVTGENNGAFGHNGKYSPYSKKFIKYNSLTEEQKISKISNMYEDLSKTLIKGQKLTNQTGYWVKMGFSEEEAKQKISERQKTFSKEKCIEQYGNEEGIKKWSERQKKWQNTLKNKSPEEIERINRSKFKNTGYSLVSQRLFNTLYEKIKIDFNEIYFATKGVSNINNEYIIITNEKKVYFTDFLIKDTNKIIEFDGDYWHGEKRGNQERDRIREKSIKSMGYDIYRVKERDFNRNPHFVIQECLNFIYDRRI